MSLTETTINFKEIEQTAQRICFEIGVEIIKEMLENWDKYCKSSIIHYWCTLYLLMSIIAFCLFSLI